MKIEGERERNQYLHSCRNYSKRRKLELHSSLKMFITFSKLQKKSSTSSYKDSKRGDKYEDLKVQRVGKNYKRLSEIEYKQWVITMLIL